MHTAESNSPLAIVGIGCLFPKAAGPGYFWANAKHAADCITAVPPTHWNPDDYFDADPKAPDMTYARRGGFLSAVDFNPLEFGIAPRDIEATDTSQLLGLVAAKQALVDAGVVLAERSQESGVRSQEDKTHGASLTPDSRPLTPVSRDRVSVILGVTGTLELVIPLGARLGHPKWRRAMKDAGIPDAAASDAAARIAESYVPWQENSFPGLLGNVVAGRIANKLDLGGTNCVVDAACASSLSAVHLAALELQAGRADVVVTGGADTFNDIFMYMCFSKTPALSPSGDAKPFDANGDGTILGEGIGVVVLKRLSDAERDGDTVYAVIKGIGSSSDGKGNAIYAPSANGQKKALRNAYALAGVTPDTIELVEAHGTGTKVGDTVEITALTDVYSGSTNPRPWCAIGSVKSQIGHTKAAAGSASLIKAALALHYKVLPPTIKVTQPVEPLRAADTPFYVNAEMRPWLPRAEHPRRAALSAFGFGGSNFHAVLEEHRPAKSEVDWDGSVEVVALSADSPHQLAAALEKLPTTWDDFARAAEASRAAFNPSATCRLAFAAHRTLTDLPKLLAGAKARFAGPAAESWHTPDGVHFGSGPAGKLAVLFPGQGSQYVGMLRELACLFPEALDALAAANADRISDAIYPPTTFDAAKKADNDRDLRDTRNAQPAIGAVSFGAWRVLNERFGMTADAFAGHSYGELVALAAAGRFGEADLFALSRTRGELMAARRDGDPGSMIAVFASAADLEPLLARHRLNLVVANKNAPNQTVLSGGTPDVDVFEKALAAANVRFARFPVAAAFHSAFVADAAVPFRAALDRVAVSASSKPVFANTTAAEYPADPDGARDLLANQLAKPVEFVDQIRAMARAGVRTFVEVGPGSVLTRLVDAILAESSAAGAEAFAVDASGGKRSGVLDLGGALARLAARGLAVRLTTWEENSRCRPPVKPAKPAQTIPICGANYVTPRTPRPANPRLHLNGTPSKVPGMPESDPTAIAQALLMTQQSLAALQRMQEQTAQLHQQFLESQEAAQRTLQALVEQQQTLLMTGLGSGATVPIAPLRVAAPPLPATESPRPKPLPPPPVAPKPAQVVVAPPPPPPKPVAPSPPLPKPAAPKGDRVAAALLSVVSEKTGYAVENLDLGLSLDGDLGIDSIKRVEILSALQERLPDAPVVKPEHLGTLHTLQDVADFLGGGQKTAAPAPAPEEDDELTRTMPVTREQLLLLVNNPPPTAPKPGPDVAAALLSVVSEKTGYAVENLDLGLSLDGDLGIDSIKRVEILSALQERLPDAPVVKPEHLGTLHTLQDVANFLGRRATPPPPNPMTTKIPYVAIAPHDSGMLTVPVTPELPAGELVAADTEQVSSIRPPQIPESMVRPQPKPRTLPAADPSETLHRPVSLNPAERIDRSILQAVDLDTTAPRLRVPLPAGGEIWLVGEPNGLTEEVANGLADQGFKVRVVGWGGPGTNRTPVALAGLVLLAPLHPAPEFHVNRLALEWLQHAGPKLRATGRQQAAVFVTVARFDGAFGLNSPAADADPACGGLAGIVKTARHEWPEVTCKAIDLDPAFAGDAADALVDEILTASPVEVGISTNHRCTLELARTVRRTTSQVVSFTAKDVVVVTGGGRGVTAEAAIALAETYSLTLVLVGRTPAPTPEPEWLAGLTAEADVKKAIGAHVGPDGGVKAIGEQYQRVVAHREIRATLKRIEAAGSRVAYFGVDATDERAVADLVQQVRVKFGPVTGLVHGAGVLADRKIEDLTPEQFDLVYATKVDALRILLDLLANEDLKALVLFSSTTARLGRIGQVAYAAANEVLNKTAQVEARRRPGCRVVSINWGPWEGGMVTPGLRRLFESEGVGLIPLDDGAGFMVNELNAAGKVVEVIALGKQRGSGSIPFPAAITGSSTPPPPKPGSGTVPVVSPPSQFPPPEMAVAFERVVDVATHPVLRSHVLDGRAVLPMALHLEWLAHAALHGNPGLVFHGFNDLRITEGVKLDSGVPATLRAFAGKAVKQDKQFVVTVELRGKRKDRETVKSRAEIVLVSALPKAPPADRPPPVNPYTVTVETAYRDLLFHGPDLQGIERIDGVSDVAFIATSLPAPPPADWFAYPLRSGWVADPLVLDASFQMMILWGQAQHGVGSLPSFAGRYRQFRRTFPTGAVTVVARITRDNGTFVRADLDYLDADGQVVAQMQDYECMMSDALGSAFRNNQLGLVKQ